MEQQIWKYELSPFNKAVEMPRGAKILTVQTQNGPPFIWALVIPENDKETRFFEIIGTGKNIPTQIGVEFKYINTFQLEGGSLVYHVFEAYNI